MGRPCLYGPRVGAEQTPRIAPGSRRQIGLLNAGIGRLSGLATGGRPPHIFTTLARHRKLFRRWLWFAGALMPRGRLPREDTELVIGDENQIREFTLTGHGIEPSITAFQAKYLLRVFLRQFRDPAQAIEELNSQMSALERAEEFISLCVIVFDTEAGTLRYASAGHPAAWLWHERDVRPLRSTGPLLMLDPAGEFHSREIPLDVGDLVVLYTDGLSEARDGDHLFGEERIANTLRRDPGADPGVLAKALLEAARDFASSPLSDDIAILALRRT